MCRKQSAPMKIPRVCLRITVYHMVEASPGPLTGCHGAAGFSSPSTKPASRSCACVATRPF